MTIHQAIFTLPWHSPAMKHKQMRHIDTGHVTEKIGIDFFDFLWVSHRFSINIRIEVHFFCFTRFTHDQLSFPNVNEKKSVFQSLIKKLSDPVSGKVGPEN